MDWSFIDKVVYINLERSPDRNEKMMKVLKPFGDKVIRFNAIDLPGRGWLGCSKSHVGVLELAIENQWKNVLILEDDVEWNHNEIAYENLKKCIETPYDVILFGGSWSRFDTNTMKLLYSQATSSYLVSSHYYKTLLDNFKEGVSLLEKEYNYKFTIDRYWQSLIEKDTWYLIVPNLFYQSATFSMIENKKVDHHSVFITNRNIIQLSELIFCVWIHYKKFANVIDTIKSLETNKWYKLEHTLFPVDPSPDNSKRLLISSKNKQRRVLKEGDYFLIQDGNFS